MYLSKGQKGMLAADNRTGLCVWVCLCLHVCTRMCMGDPLVTDARLFMCEVWKRWVVGRWVDTHVFASVCVMGSVCVRF